MPVTPRYPRAGESHGNGHRVIPSGGKIHVGNQLEFFCDFSLPLP